MYKEEKKGLAHQTSFVVTVTIDGVEYTVESSSKKKAKMKCAELAMVTLRPVFEKEKIEWDRKAREKEEKAALAEVERLEKLERIRAEKALAKKSREEKALAEKSPCETTQAQKVDQVVTIIY